MDKILIVIGCEFIVFLFIAANIQNFFNKMHLSHNLLLSLHKNTLKI